MPLSPKATAVLGCLVRRAGHLVHKAELFQAVWPETAVSDGVLAAISTTAPRLSRPFGLVLLAEAAAHAGQVEEGLCLLADARTAFEASGRGDQLAETYRLQGELLRRQAVPDTAQAEACFQQALTLARRQQAKAWELRAATSLARLWQGQGKRDDARGEFCN